MSKEALTQKEPVSERKHILFSLFAAFFKIGAFTFGGGYAMIPLIEHEACDHHHWISSEDLLDIIAIAESTPGPIAINSATFIGKKTAGFWGSFFATLGVVLPSFVIILIVSALLAAFEDLKVIRYAFWGIRAGVLALILKALWSMYKKCPKSLISYILMSASLICAAVLKINAILIIIGCALIGLTVYLYTQRRNQP